MSRCAKSAQKPHSEPGQLPGKPRRQRLRLTGCVLLTLEGIPHLLGGVTRACRCEATHRGQLSHRQQRDTEWISLQCRKGLNAKGGGPRMHGRPAMLGSCRSSGTQTQALYGRTALLQPCSLLPLVWVRSSCEELVQPTIASQTLKIAPKSIAAFWTISATPGKHAE